MRDRAWPSTVKDNAVPATVRLKVGRAQPDSEVPEPVLGCNPLVPTLAASPVA